MGQLIVNLTSDGSRMAIRHCMWAINPRPTLSIIGANSTVSFSSANYAVNKNTGNGAAVITVIRNDSSIGPASVDFMTTTNGTATPGTDYTPVSNTVFFADGQTTQTVVVPIANNGLPEGNLTVGLALINPTNTALDPSLPTTATLTIVDNSQAPGNLEFSATSYSVPENGHQRRDHDCPHQWQRRNGFRELFRRWRHGHARSGLYAGERDAEFH